MKVILDTNFIIACVKKNIRVFDEFYEFIIPEEVVFELEKLRKSRSIEDREAASVALDMIDKLKLKKIKLGNTNVDEGILEFIEKNKGIMVATFDKELKRKLKGKAEIFNIKR